MYLQVSTHLDAVVTIVTTIGETVPYALDRSQSGRLVRYRLKLPWMARCSLKNDEGLFVLYY